MAPLLPAVGGGILFPIFLVGLVILGASVAFSTRGSIAEREPA
jgi:hypothetical protein